MNDDLDRGAPRRGIRRAGATAVALMLAALLASFAPPAPAGATTPPGPFTINLQNRENVRQSWYSTYLASNGFTPGWTGSVAGCNPGDVSSDYRAATLTRTNWFRAMAGVPSNVVFTAANNANAQKAALIMNAQNDLSHDPPASWACWTQAGHDAAGTSSLNLGGSGADAIDSFMYDGGSDNTFAGHRRNMLNPDALQMGSGSVPGSAGHSASEAQYFGTGAGSAQPARDTFVAWPPPGFVPYGVVFPRWTLVQRGANFAAATISVKQGGTTLPSTIISRQDWAGPGLVWTPNNLADGARWPKPTNDQPITTTISNVTINGTPGQTIVYTTTIFDPADADPSHTALTITGSDTPTAGQPNAYSVNTIPNATGYQWRTTKLTPQSFTDGAEGGLTNWTAATSSSYNPASTVTAATGTHSFQLDVGASQGTFQPQSLTMKKVFVPAAGGQLTFKTRAVSLGFQGELGVDAVVEASLDDGATWQTLYTEAGIDEPGFTNRSVSLASLAGKHVTFRLRASYISGQPLFTGDNLGWFVDDFALTSVLAADAAVLSATNPGTGFSLTPEAGASYDIEVRADFVGSGFGAFSNAKRLTAGGGGGITFATALDNTNLPFSSTGSAQWAGQTAVSHDGVDAAKSGAIGNSQSSNLVTTVTGPTKLKFWWKSDTESGFDFLKVTVDGTEPFAGISGATDWQQKKITIPEGTHTVQWTYSKDVSQTGGADAVWVDQVTTGAK